MELTERAVHEFQKIVESEGAECTGIRIRARRLGRTTFRYDCHLVRAVDTHSTDITVPAGKTTVYLDPQTAEWMLDARVDFVADGRGTGLLIDNPAAEPVWDDPVAARIQEVIDQQILPAVVPQGAWVELMKVEDSTAHVVVGGTDHLSSEATAALRQDIAATIVKAVDTIEAVSEYSVDPM
jgi:Fe/S biogenesis protein NfuA